MSQDSEVDDARGALEHGSLCYLQLPAKDVPASAIFYEKLFGWKNDRPHPSFEAPGAILGQFVDDRPASANLGPLLWLNVTDIEATLESTETAGGQILEQPMADGPRRLATIRDPGGNTIGIVQHGPG